MSLFAIADLHLSFGVEKPMDIFNGWEGYVEKLEQNWRDVVKKDDLVVVAGDISWGMNLKESYLDFKFLNDLPGQKILLKGNHDYYFDTKSKMDKFFLENGFSSLRFLHNNSYEYGAYSICGTRGWVNMSSEESDNKILRREAMRLRLSLDSAKNKPIVFLHYPPIFCGGRAEEILEVLNEKKVESVYYGHLHGKACEYAIKGKIEGIEYGFISSDFLDFKLFKIL